MLVINMDLQFDDTIDAMDVVLNVTAACSVRQSQWSSKRIVVGLRDNDPTR